MADPPKRTGLDNVSIERLRRGIIYSRVVLAAGAFFTLVWAWDGAGYLTVRKTYQEVTCKPAVTEVPRPADSTHPSLPPSPTYEYVVQGQVHHSSVRRTQGVIFNWDGYRQVTQEDLSGLGPTGHCFYDPRDPSKAVLFRGLPEPWFGCGFLVAAIEFIALANLQASLQELKRRRAA